MGAQRSKAVKATKIAFVYKVKNVTFLLLAFVRTNNGHHCNRKCTLANLNWSRFAFRLTFLIYFNANFVHYGNNEQCTLRTLILYLLRQGRLFWELYLSEISEIYVSVLLPFREWDVNLIREVTFHRYCPTAHSRQLVKNLSFTKSTLTFCVWCPVTSSIVFPEVRLTCRINGNPCETKEHLCFAQRPTAHKKGTKAP